MNILAKSALPHRCIVRLLRKEDPEADLEGLARDALANVQRCIAMNGQGVRHLRRETALRFYVSLHGRHSEIPVDAMPLLTNEKYRQGVRASLSGTNLCSVVIELLGELAELMDVPTVVRTPMKDGGGGLASAAAVPRSAPGLS